MEGEVVGERARTSEESAERAESADLVSAERAESAEVRRARKEWRSADVPGGRSKCWECADSGAVEAGSVQTAALWKLGECRQWASSSNGCGYAR